MRRVVPLLALLAAVLFAPGAAAEAPVKAVATFSILGDLVRQVGGDRVAVTSLVGPGSDAHAYSPSPADARAIGAAQVVFANGLGFEGWMTRLVAAARSQAATVVASRGVAPLTRQSGGTAQTDPHAWQSIANAKLYVANIRDGLAAVDRAGSATYAANATSYLAKLDALEAEVKAALGKIPPPRRRVITTHDAFGYFAAAYGFDFIAAEGVSAESEASAKDVARIIAQIRREKVPAVFLENVSDPRLMQQIAGETGAKIGGTLYSDALSGPDGPAATYIDMMRSNARALIEALAD